jgi:hypothetical protein
MHGGVYYRPYTVHGRVVYGYIPPPYYVYYPSPPVGAIVVTVAAMTLLYWDGTYYKKTTTGGSGLIAKISLVEGAGRRTSTTVRWRVTLFRTTRSPPFFVK